MYKIYEMNFTCVCICEHG